MLTADITLSTGVDFQQSFQIGGGAVVTFSGNQLGDITPNGPGTYLYTPHPGAMGTDHFTATYQPYYGGYGGYTPPPVTETIDMNLLLIFGATGDASYQNPDPATQSAYPNINYFVLKDNVLSISAANGVLKNDSIAEYVQYLTAEQIGNGQYGTFAIEASGAFTYTPFSWVFDSPLFTQAGLEDTCQYVAKGNGQTSQPATVTVDLVELYISRNGNDLDANAAMLNVWVGEKVAVSVASRGEFPAVPGIATFEWCIGGTVVDGYTGYSEGDSADSDGPGVAKVIPLSLAEVESPSVDYYWVDEGGHDISVTIETIGQVRSDDAEFLVNRPSVSVSVADSGIRIVTGLDRVELSHEDESFEFTQGITFTRTTTDEMAEQPGSYRWTQIVNYDYVSWVDSNGDWHDDEKPGGVDNSVVYPQQNAVHAWDSPSADFNGTEWSTFFRGFSASMYLMYRHSSADSIWIPINVTDWSFNFVIDKDSNGVWSFHQSPPNPITGETQWSYTLPITNNPAPATPEDTLIFPTWDTTYING